MSDCGFTSDPVADDRPIPLCTTGCGNDCDTDRDDGKCSDCVQAERVGHGGG